MKETEGGGSELYVTFKCQILDELSVGRDAEGGDVRGVVIAADDGIHWKTIHRTAELVKYVSEHSPHSQGTFNFTATAMLRPFSPFFPGSYHTGSGGQFAVGFEGADVVREVFVRDKGNADSALTDLTAALTKHASICKQDWQRSGCQDRLDLYGSRSYPCTSR